MTTTATPTAATFAVRVGHSGRSIHRATGDADGTRLATLCGAERRHAGVGRLTRVEAPLTCRACLGTPAPAVEAAPVAPTAPRTPSELSTFNRVDFLTEAVTRLAREGDADRAEAAARDLAEATGTDADEAARRARRLAGRARRRAARRAARTA